MAFASKLLPVPGGPNRPILCPPLTATSKARLASGWFLISTKSFSKSVFKL